MNKKKSDFQKVGEAAFVIMILILFAKFLRLIGFLFEFIITQIRTIIKKFKGTSLGWREEFDLANKSYFDKKNMWKWYVYFIPGWSILLLLIFYKDIVFLTLLVLFLAAYFIKNKKKMRLKH